MEFLLDQIREFNLIQFIFTIFFIVSFTKSNQVKLLDKQTQEIHEEIEELKDCVRWKN